MEGLAYVYSRDWSTDFPHCQPENCRKSMTSKEIVKLTDRTETHKYGNIYNIKTKNTEKKNIRENTRKLRVYFIKERVSLITIGLSEQIP